MKTWFICLTAVLGLFSAAEAAKPGFFQQEESAQHLLQAKGDRFRFFKHNLICNNWKFAGFDAKDKTGKEPSLHLSDTNGKEGVILHSHNPVACQPFTQYRLRFKSKLISCEAGPLPDIEIKLFDFNRDYIRSLTFGIPAEDAGKGWTDHELVFITGYDVYALMSYFESAGKTVCDVVFDEVYAEQISDAGAFQPEARPLFSVEKIRSGRLGEERVNSPEDACRFAFGFSWDARTTRQALIFEWLDEAGKVTGTETCRFNPATGILPAWNGIQTEWFRRYGDSTDKVHCRLDRHFNTSADSGRGRLEGILLKPEGAVYIRVRLTEESITPLEIQNFVLAAQPLDIRN